MTMDEDRLSRIFADYEPELPDDRKFLMTLERNMDAMEFIKREQRESKRHNRLAMTAACVAGMATGCLSSIVAPYTAEWTGSILATLNKSLFVPAIADVLVVTYIIGGMLTVLLTLATYDITLGIVSREK